MRLLLFILFFSITIFAVSSQQDPFLPNDQTEFNLQDSRDPSLRPIRKIYYKWDSFADSLALDHRNAFVYNPSGALILSNYQSWQDHEWSDQSRFIQVFNDKNQFLTQQGEEWYQNSWIPTHRYIHSYDDTASGSIILQYWVHDKWISDLKKYSDFNPLENTLTETYQYEVEGAWNNDYREVTYFKPDKKINAIIRERYIYEGWEREHLTTFYYSQNGMLNEKKTYSWQSDQWKEVILSSYAYDNHNNLISISSYGYDSLNTLSDYKTEFGYDGNGNRIRETYYTGKNGEWHASHQEIIIYDDEGRKRSSLSQAWINGWRDRELILYEYASNVISPQSDGLPAIYPNPAGDILHLVIPETTGCPCRISISDLNGPAIQFRTDDRSGILTIPIGLLLPGWYLFKVEAGNQVSSQILIKQK